MAASSLPPPVLEPEKGRRDSAVSRGTAGDDTATLVSQNYPAASDVERNQANHKDFNDMTDGEKALVLAHEGQDESSSLNTIGGSL